METYQLLGNKQNSNALIDFYIFYLIQVVTSCLSKIKFIKLEIEKSSKLGNIVFLPNTRNPNKEDRRNDKTCKPVQSTDSVV